MAKKPRVEFHLVTGGAANRAPSELGVRSVPRKLYSEVYPTSVYQVQKTGFSCSTTFFADLYSPAIVRSSPELGIGVWADGISTTADPGPAVGTWTVVSTPCP